VKTNWLQFIQRKNETLNKGIYMCNLFTTARTRALRFTKLAFHDADNKSLKMSAEVHRKRSAAVSGQKAPPPSSKRLKSGSNETKKTKQSKKTSKVVVLLVTQVTYLVLFMFVPAREEEINKCVGCNGSDDWVGHLRGELCAQCYKAFGDLSCRQCHRLREDPDECDEDGLCDDCQPAPAINNNGDAAANDGVDGKKIAEDDGKDTMVASDDAKGGDDDGRPCGCHHSGPMEPYICAFHLEKMQYQNWHGPSFESLSDAEFPSAAERCVEALTALNAAVSAKKWSDAIVWAGRVKESVELVPISNRVDS
jgi:hypothetical protein